MRVNSQLATQENRAKSTLKPGPGVGNYAGPIN